MERKTVGVGIIVCKDDGTWYKDYEFVKTYYPEHEDLAMDALLEFSNKVQSDDIIHMAVMDVTVAEPDLHMQDNCIDVNTGCPECPHFEYCFE